MSEEFIKYMDNLFSKYIEEFNIDIRKSGLNNKLVLKDIIEISGNEEYLSSLKEEFDYYILQINNLSISPLEKDKILKEDVRENCHSVLKIAKLLIDNHEDEAKEEMKALLSKYNDNGNTVLDNDFIFCEINKCFSFRGSGSNSCLCDNDEIYEQMNREDIVFYRSRIIETSKKIDKFSEITSLSYSNKHCASNCRFSKAGKSCLYLSLTSDACSLEIDSKDRFDQIYTSAFKFNNSGLKKIKVLNLALNSQIIDGIISQINRIGEAEERKNYLTNLSIDYLKIYPLSIATSFVRNSKQTEKNYVYYEYLISQCIIETLSEITDDKNIYGVSYISKKKIGDSIFPYYVNLAIPINDLSEDEEFGEIYNYIEMTKPISNKYAIENYADKDKEKNTYLDTAFGKDYHFRNNLKYKDTDCYKVDHYLINMKTSNAMEELKSEKESQY